MRGEFFSPMRKTESGKTIVLLVTQEMLDGPRLVRLSEGLRRVSALFQQLKGQAGSKLAQEFALSSAHCQLLRLLMWGHGSMKFGEIGHLSPRKFAEIVGWADRSDAEDLFEAWIDSGLIERRDFSVFIADWDSYVFEEMEP